MPDNLIFYYFITNRIVLSSAYLIQQPNRAFLFEFAKNKVYVFPGITILFCNVFRRNASFKIFNYHSYFVSHWITAIYGQNTVRPFDVNLVVFHMLSNIIYGGIYKTIYIISIPF